MYYYGRTNYQREKRPDGSVTVTRSPALGITGDVIMIPFMLWGLAIIFTMLCWTGEFMYNFVFGGMWDFVLTVTPWLCLICWVFVPLYKLASAWLKTH